MTARLAMGDFSPEVSLADWGELEIHGNDAFVDFDKACDTQTRTRVVSHDTSKIASGPAGVIGLYHCNLKPYSPDEMRMATALALKHASLDGMKSILISFPDQAESPLRSGLSQMLMGIMEYIGASNVDALQNIEHIVVGVDTNVYKAWTSANGPLESWFKANLARANCPGLRVVTKTQTEANITTGECVIQIERKITIDESDIQKAMENMDAFFQQNRRRVWSRPHIFESKNRDILASISAVERSLSTADLQQMHWMIMFVANWTPLGFDTLLQAKTLKDLPEETRNRLIRLNIPFMERLLELMKDDKLRRSQAERIPTYADGSPQEMWWAKPPYPAPPLFAEIYMCLGISWHVWRRLPDVKRDTKTAFERMLMCLEGTIEELRAKH